MSYNRIAVYGHRGWAGSVITKALIASGAPVKILHRPSSDTSHLPSDIVKIPVDVDDVSQLVAALQDVDIVISLVGQPAIASQFAFLKAIPHTEVKLFVPSDLGSNITEQQLKVPPLRVKHELLTVAKDAKIPTTSIWPGSMVESSFATTLLGVDVPGNRIVHTGNSENEYLDVCSIDYVAAAYVDIFTRTSISQIANRAIRLREFHATGHEISDALERRHGKAPETFRQTLAKVEKDIDARLAKGDFTAIALTYRYPWGEGTNNKYDAKDLWTVEGYEKTTLDAVVVNGKLGDYKQLPPFLVAGLESTFVDNL